MNYQTKNLNNPHKEVHVTTRTHGQLNKTGKTTHEQNEKFNKTKNLKKPKQKFKSR